MFLLNVSLTTRAGQPISLPWLRAAFMLNGVQVKRSAVKNRAEGDVFTAELRKPLPYDALECLAESLNLNYVSYYDARIACCVGTGLRAAVVPERFLLLSGATLDTVLTTAAELEEWERDEPELERFEVDGKPLTSKLVRTGLPSPNWRENITRRYGKWDESASRDKTEMDGVLSRTLPSTSQRRATLADELVEQDEQLPGEWTCEGTRRATWSGGAANFQNIPRAVAPELVEQRCYANQKLACGCELMPLTGALAGESALVVKCAEHTTDYYIGLNRPSWDNPLEQGDQP